MIVNGGTQLDLGDSDLTLGAVTLDGGSTLYGGSISATSLTLDGGSIYADSISVAGPVAIDGGSIYADLSGTGNLDVTGDATLAGAVDFSGGTTTVESGVTLELACPPAEASLGQVEVQDGGTLAFGSAARRTGRGTRPRAFAAT